MYTKKSESDKAIHMLEGLLKGITLDSSINNNEIIQLNSWINLNQDYCNMYPFKEVYLMLEDILSDGIISDDERKDLLWFCNKVTTNNLYYDLTTSDIQRLNGILHGIIADKVISEIEIVSLKNWLYENEHLTATYPYDELMALIVNVLEDGVITEDEKKLIERYVLEFVDESSLTNYSAKEISDIKKSISIGGICSIAPEIKIKGASIVFSGKSSRATRSEFAHIVESHGGKVVSAVSMKTNYLIIGDDGNPCWSYACYGRKIEKAIQLRSEGTPISIIHENDFWDEVEY